MTEPRMFYFGPWNREGHYFYGPGGSSVSYVEQDNLPWGPRYGWKIDGGLIPNKNYRAVGKAFIVHEHGWTALSFWDMSVDNRPASHSTYIAEGSFSFEEMVLMAKTRFADRWNKMEFKVVMADQTNGEVPRG